MDIIMTPPYEEMQKIYESNFSLNYLGSNISNKFALISLTCYLVNKLKQKSPDITHYSLLNKINNAGNNPVPTDLIKRLAVICSDFGYGCNDFPLFGLKDKDMPAKIKEILSNWIPF